MCGRERTGVVFCRYIACAVVSEQESAVGTAAAAVVRETRKFGVEGGLCLSWYSFSRAMQMMQASGSNVIVQEMIKSEWFANVIIYARRVVIERTRREDPVGGILDQSAMPTKSDEDSSLRPELLEVVFSLPTAPGRFEYFEYLAMIPSP